MPVYNTKEEYLREAIESILNQTFQDFELLIIDDGSEPYVKQTIETYKDTRIKYIQNEQNLGLVKTLNKGLDISQGEYIARMDSDDISLPTRFEKQITYMENNPNVGVLGTWAEAFPKSEIWKPSKHYSFIDLIKWDPFIIHPSTMLRNSIIKKHNIRYTPELEISEDYDFWTKLIHITKIHNLEEPLLKYRISGDNISIKNREKSISRFKQTQQKSLDFLTTDTNLQEKIKLLIHKHNRPYKIKERIFYIAYKFLWIACGKKNLFEKQMKQAKQKLKQKRFTA